MRTVLFVCSGNYYRSRFAELYFGQRAAQRGLAWRARSRGLRLTITNVGPLAACAAAGLAERGVSVPAPCRHPILLAERDLAAADLVIALKAAEHRPLLAAGFPAWVERVEYWSIDDVDCATPEQALPQLERELEGLLARLANGGPGD